LTNENRNLTDLEMFRRDDCPLAAAIARLISWARRNFVARRPREARGDSVEPSGLLQKGKIEIYLLFQKCGL
jgi:hypothetical protein